MLKRSFVSVGILAVLLTGIIPAGDACALGATNDHGCCATPGPKATSSCCTSPDGPVRSPKTDNAMDCACDHPPATPATVAATSTPSSTEDDGQPAHTAHIAVTHEETLTGVRAKEHRVRSHPPPPVFLLDCCFLT